MYLTKQKIVGDQPKILEKTLMMYTHRAAPATLKWSRESSNRYVYDASYGWVKNVTLGYTLPKTNYFNSIRVFVGVNNLFMITNYPGNNPDVSQRGSTQGGNDDEAYPVPRTFSIGAKFNF